MSEARKQVDLPPLVQRTLRRLVRAFAPERVVLFGSYAKGTVHQRSDIDLLVITSFGGNALVQQRRARQLSADCFPRVDVVFATPEDVAAAPAAKSPFLQSILGIGITIYAARRDAAAESNAINLDGSMSALHQPMES